MTDNEIIKANTESNTEKQNQYGNCEITDDEVVEDLKKWISMSKYISEPVFVQHILLQRILNVIIRLKKENDDLFYKLQGVMWSVDKWLDGDELEQDEVNRAITMREKTLQITEKQQAEIEQLKKTVVDLNSNLSESVNCFTRMESLYKIKCKELEVVKTKARKNLAEKLYEKIEQNSKFGFDYVTKKEIENVVRELEKEDGNE